MVLLCYCLDMNINIIIFRFNLVHNPGADGDHQRRDGLHVRFLLGQDAPHQA